MELFLQFSAIVILVTTISVLFKLCKQPLVAGYILTGILIGPHILNLLHTASYIDLFSKIGITILLFIVGINLSPSVIKEVGKVSVLGGTGQIVITTILGFLLCVLLGISLKDSLFAGIALSFSSTIIILKLLSDKGDLPKLYGKISVGFLLIQDLVAIVVLLFVASFTSQLQYSFVQIGILLILKLFIAASSVYFITKYIFSRTIHHLAESQELLFLFSIAWGLGLASVFYIIGFSVEVGALIAGVSLSVSPFADGIASRLKPLRDFFIILFFILLGSNVMVANIAILILPIVILSLFVLIGKPLIVFLLLHALGYKTKQGFQTGISLAQISEFSLIFAALGVSTGQLSNNISTVITLTALLTIAISSYFILYSENIYPVVLKKLKFLELFPQNTRVSNKINRPDLILFGFDRVGHDFIEAFIKLRKKYLVVDYNPQMIHQLESSEVPFKYGDVEDLEFLDELQLDKIKLCVSTIPNVKVNTLLLNKIREVNHHAIIILRARETFEAKRLYELGASYVVMPHYLGAKYATSLIKKFGLDSRGFEEEKEKHLAYVHKN